MEAGHDQSERLPRERAEALLAEHGIAATEQRVEIASLLFARHQHLSAEQVLARLGEQACRVSKATVYNTLNLFVQAGLVREVMIDPTRTLYDSNLAPHHHVFHTDSGLIEDVSPVQVHIQQLPDLPPATEILGVDVVIRVASRKPA